MADIIKTVGSSGADFTTWQAWFNARTGGAGDRYIMEITTSGGGLSSGSTAIGEYAGELIIRAAAGLEFDPENPIAPHAAITSASSFTLTTSSILKFENVEVRNTGVSPTTALINTNTGVAKTTIRNCWLRGGRYGAINNVAGSTLLVENTIITETTRIGVYNFVAGATIRNTVIANCSTESGTSNAYGGVRKDIAGTVLENVVCFNNGNVDFFGATTTATVSYLASEDATATGTGALTGVTSTAFTNYASNIFTAATSGVLDGTGPSGNDRGLVLAGAPAIYITTPVAWDLYARNPATNTGSISITGTYRDATPTAIEARWGGGTWTTIDAAPAGGSYSGSLTGLAAGNGTLEVRMANVTSVTASVDNVAIGAKFLAWGQSNFSGRATNAQTYTGTAGWFHKFTVTNNQWQQGGDPFDTATANGSLFPELASLLTAALGCPVGFIGVAMGSTALAAWQPGQSLNTRMVDYYNAATAHGSGGIEAVISWIGESDADAGTAEADFKTRYNTVIDQLKTLTGKDSLLVAPSGLDTTNYANVRQWINDIAAASANTAPDEVQMWPLFQKIHYETDTETSLAADAIFDGMVAGFYSQQVTVIPAQQSTESAVVAISVSQNIVTTNANVTNEAVAATISMVQAIQAVTGQQGTEAVQVIITQDGAAPAQDVTVLPAEQLVQSSQVSITVSQQVTSENAEQLVQAEQALVSMLQSITSLNAQQAVQALQVTVTQGGLPPVQDVTALPAQQLTEAVSAAIGFNQTVISTAAQQATEAVVVSCTISQGVVSIDAETDQQTEPAVVSMVQQITVAIAQQLTQAVRAGEVTAPPIIAAKVKVTLIPSRFTINIVN